jgi:hypothetical protein
MTLDGFFSVIAPYLAGRADLARTAAALGDVDARRLAIYGRFCAIHRHEILEKIYLHCRDVLGARWEEVVAAYFAAHPARDWELNANAEPFVEFARARIADAPPWLGDLADLEWWEWAVWVAPSRAEPTRGAAPAAAPRAARLAVAPGVAIRAYAYDVVAWADAPAAARPAAPPRRDHLVVFWRDPDGLAVRRAEAQPIELIALKAALEGLTVAAAATASGVAPAELAATVRDLVAAGILRRRRARA